MEFDFDFSPIVIIAIFASIVFSIVKFAKNMEKNAKNQAKQADAQKQLVQQQQAKRQQSKPAESKKSAKATPSVQFSSDHQHSGDAVEQYAPIEGSLGQVSTEGCVEMDGFRLIANDENFDGEGNKTTFNLNKVAQAMVLGEILDNPRFKNPPKR